MVRRRVPLVATAMAKLLAQRQMALVARDHRVANAATIAAVALIVTANAPSVVIGPSVPNGRSVAISN